MEKKTIFFSLAICMAVTIITLFAYAGIDLLMMKDDYQLFIIKLSVGKAGQSLVFIVMTYMLYTSQKLDFKSRVIVVTLGLMNVVNLYNAVFELVRSPAFQIILPTTLLCILIYLKKRDDRKDLRSN